MKIKLNNEPPNRKSLVKRLDAAWSELAKIKAGYRCEICGKTTELNTHHIYSRVRMSVRWDIDNASVICVAHHIGSELSAHKTPFSFCNLLNAKRGQQAMARLELKAMSTCKWTTSDLQLLLADLRRQIVELKDGAK